ncbi:gliding motility-associated C-terminal domain-containing protein [Mucilaginibacter sp. FT3.2]|uniref:T9SS type B sorting domain-containing protein n=1 Tax=Mucilaginibacter sp. FT3.2 TaxID=2723090 RepID=UPI00161B396A|nr:gliding motility-associated C-terminal domain-containing protein [Mucilaginibacter sp. FT3.2]MBB6235065.1 gliding motility-associated-like protein [Mucilaginibacter sp. FT3.2]
MRSFFSTFCSAVFLVVLLVFNTQHLYAQAPVIRYTTPKVYAINKPITNLIPANTGGAVPATIYGQVTTIAGYGHAGYLGTVTGVTVDEAGNVYILDWQNNVIRKLTPVGNLSLFVGSGATGSTDGTGSAASFNEPDGIVIGPTGDFFVSDQGNNLIRKITPAGVVTTLAGGIAAGAANGKGNLASFNNPRALAADVAGNLYVADQGNNLIRKITPDGTVTTYAGNGLFGFTNASTALSASFNTPTGVGIDVAGNLYVSDAGNGVIRKITPAGVVSTFATGFVFPRELRVDGSGNVYVCDQNSNFVKRISPAGVVSSVAGNGQPGYVDGIGNGASFNGLLGMAMDGKGNLFVGEDNNNVARQITISGYTIDKPLPAGLSFDSKTGTISGTPTQTSPATDYVVTAYNGGGSNSTIVNIEVIVPKPSIITFPPPVNLNIDPDNILHPDATSTNNETPITYTSSNPAVAYIGTDGQIHVIAPGLTTITANQAGNDTYLPASSVQEFFTIKQNQVINFPAIAVKSTCSADFFAGSVSSNSLIPITYSNTNPAVATVSASGNVHIIGSGTTTITASQAGNTLYIAALPVSQTLTVTPLVTPSVTITPNFYGSCDGILVTYTATAVNAGNNPTYQWKLNGDNTGDNSPVYASTTLKTGDVITCIVTDNDQCTPVSSPASNPASLTADANVTVGVTIASSVSGTVDIGTPITFKATPSANVQDAPIYSWMVNGQNAGSNSPTFTSNTLADGDVITCTMVTGGKCIVNPSVTSNAITVSISIPAKIVVPNAFTPNGDGNNDTWNIAALVIYPNCTVNIYNRYGIVVYQSKGYRTPWDGRMNGKLLPTGTYYYIIDTQKNSQKLSGPVTILK